LTHCPRQFVNDRPGDFRCHHNATPDWLETQKTISPKHHAQRHPSSLPKVPVMSTKNFQNTHIGAVGHFGILSF